jgi:hypothetical protein
MLEPRGQVKRKPPAAGRPAKRARTDRSPLARRARPCENPLLMWSFRYVSLCAVLCAIAGCDGTITGIGRVPRAPEPPLPPAPVETVDPANPEPAEALLEEISAQHLLVMYQGSKSAARSIKRSKEEARIRATEALDAIKRGQDFDKVVSAYTDEPGGAARRGALGRFSRDKMVKAFSDAAFALKVGEISPVVESPFGFHVIRRIE